MKIDKIINGLLATCMVLLAIQLTCLYQLYENHTGHDCRRNSKVQDEMKLKDSLYQHYSGIILSDMLHKWRIKMQ